MTHVIAVRLTEGEWVAFKALQQSYNITAQQLLHGIIIDALVDEGYDALRCRQQERREGTGEEGEVRGATTP